MNESSYSSSSSSVAFCHLYFLNLRVAQTDQRPHRRESLPDENLMVISLYIEIKGRSRPRFFELIISKVGIGLYSATYSRRFANAAGKYLWIATTSATTYKPLLLLLCYGYKTTSVNFWALEIS